MSIARAPLTFLVALLLAAVPADRVGVWADSDDASSRVEFGGATFTVTHGLPTGALPSLPDLSRPRRQRIPNGVVLKTTLPTLWSDVVVPAGEYELWLVVGEKLELTYGLTPFSGGNELLVPVERGRYSDPGSRLDVFLQASQSEDRNLGALQVRWGSLLFQGNFAPLRKNVQVLGERRLITYEFPWDLIPGARLPLGELEGTGSGEPARVLALTIDRRDRVSLELERRDHRRQVAQAATIRRELKILRRQQRDADADADAAAAAGDSNLASRIKTLAARLGNLQRTVERNRETAVQSIPAQVSATPTPTRRVTVSLGDGGTLIVQAPPAQQWTFRIR